ncbi:Meckel syndrome type 1 protein [Trachymyrmex septentrionalis]|uniref:Meckel syndrome type 1 protein n=1 Tax=Trachymyrmex septentrionalis TaxID=34720 RepID=A0A195F8F3_9HYME|nr:PREDICTED: Meckel syndrome type 1 protein [Trachymyrmex septentrionalis]KYN36661.1 Meckel syndrome type 1 protein [Trachymyrmex septentrionalis]
MVGKKERMRIAASYRVNEPIHNLKIRVRVVQERSPLAELLAEKSEDGETRDSNFLEEENCIFSWQDKVFSLFEIDFYAEEKNCLTECQREYHQRIRDEQLQGACLYSYTGNDSYYPDDDLLTMPYRSYLSVKNQTALPALRNRKSFQERYNKNVIDDKTTDTTIQSNHYLYTEHTTMYVMADLSRRDEPATIGSMDSETLLCTLTYDKTRKLLTINPDFTIDDEHKQHYNVTNDYGVRFNYWIEHVSEERTPLELQEHLEDVRREVQQQFAYKETELYKELQSPPANLSTLVISLDIVSAHDFSYDGLFITYFIDLPQNWSTNQKERLVGRTQKSRLTNKTAYFSYCTDIPLYYPSNEFQSLNNNVSSRWPRLLFSAASLDSWTRYRIEGYAALPIPMTPGRYKFTIPTWRAKGSIIDTLRRFFVGGSYELEDVTYCGIPINHEGKVLDKSNLKVVPSGDIKIYMNIIHQSRAHMKHFNYQRDDSDKVSTDTLMNNVENVLEQFKAAKERMIRIRTTNS